MEKLDFDKRDFHCQNNSQYENGEMIYYHLI